MVIKSSREVPGSRKRARTSRKKVANIGLSENTLRKLVPEGLVTTFINSKLHDKALAIAGLGAPSDWEGEMPELPNELGDLDHDELSNLLAQFVNAHSTAIWNASKNYVEADAYQDIADYLENIALGEVRGSNESQRKALARTTDNVVVARALQKQHYHNYVRFRDNAKTLDLRAKAVSRIGGFVGDEADDEELSAGKYSTRGKASGKSRGSAKGSGRARARR